MVNFNLPFPELYPIILEAIQPTTGVFLVGGCVRDLILGCEPQDIDLALSADVRKVSRMIANHFDGAVYSLDDERETMRVMVQHHDRQWKLDIALLRGGNLADDLQTRDFTINAMAIELEKSGDNRFIDLLDGQEHLRNQVIEACSATSIIDDPIRILRAERLAIRFGFSITESTQQQMVEAVIGIRNVSGERQRDEIFKLLMLPGAQDGLEHLSNLGIFDELFPVFTEAKIFQIRKFQTLIAEVANLKIQEYLRSTLNEDRSILSLVCAFLLLKEPDESIGAGCDIYALSNRERAFLERIQSGLIFIENMQMGVELTPREIYLFYQTAKDAGVSVCMISLALSNGREKIQRIHQLIEAYFSEYDRYMNVIPILNGNDLIRIFHLEPGPKFRELLASLKEAQVIGIVSTRTEAELFITRLLK